MAAEGTDESQALDQIDEIAMKRLIPTKGLAATGGLTREEADLIARWDRERAVKAEASAAHALLVGLYAVFFSEHVVLGARDPGIAQVEMLVGRPRGTSDTKTLVPKLPGDEGARKVIIKRRWSREDDLTMNDRKFSDHPETEEHRVVLWVPPTEDSSDNGRLYTLVARAAMDAVKWTEGPDTVRPLAADNKVSLAIGHEVLMAVVRGFFERHAVVRRTRTMNNWDEVNNKWFQTETVEFLENTGFNKRLRVILAHYLRDDTEAKRLAREHDRMASNVAEIYRARASSSQ
jgi:hypothetical protein